MAAGTPGGAQRSLTVHSTCSFWAWTRIPVAKSRGAAPTPSCSSRWCQRPARSSLLSVPRDLLVEIEPGVEDRINAAYSYGGIEETMGALQGYAWRQ